MQELGSEGPSPLGGHASSLFIKAKSRKNILAWMEDAMEQAESASTDGKVPVCVLHRDGKRYADALVMCRLSEFVKLADTGSVKGVDRC